MRNDYGAGGGNFIGVCAGVDVDSGVGDASGDDVGDACDALAERSLVNGISAIRATSIGTTTPTATAHFVQYRMVEPWAIDSPCC